MKRYETIHEQAKQFIDRLETIDRERVNGPVIQPVDERSLARMDALGIPTDGRALEDVVNDTIDHILGPTVPANHPHFFGFIPGPAERVAWLGDVMTNAYNPHAGGFTMAETALHAEQIVLDFLAETIGYSTDTYGGLFVSGGSMANLTALVAARDAKLEEDALHHGTAYVSDQTHSSVAKAFKIAGIPTRNVRRVPSNPDTFALDVDALEQMIQRDVNDGFRPFAVVGTVGTTNTGTIDPIESIAQVAETYDLWFHIDGAYGGTVLLSEPYRHLARGVDRSDSFSWDGHKWLYQTYGSAMVFVKDRTHLFNSYETKPEYLRDVESTGDKWNTWDVGIEMTRPARGVKLWMTLQALGTKTLSKRITTAITNAEALERMIDDLPMIERISPASLGIINFRFIDDTLDERALDAWNERIVQTINDRGDAGLYTTILNGKRVIRLATIHPDVTPEELGTILRTLTRIAEQTKRIA